MLIMSLISENLHIFLFIDFLLIWDIPCGWSCVLIYHNIPMFKPWNWWSYPIYIAIGLILAWKLSCDHWVSLLYLLVKCWTLRQYESMWISTF
jgi:hypothetical protein